MNDYSHTLLEQEEQATYTRENVRLIWVTPEAEKLVAYMARVSNPKYQNKEDISGLLKYCVKNQHWSIFEMVNAVFEIDTTRDIGRQILRHRSFCLGADSVIWFDLPDENSPLNFKPYKKTISYLYDRFHNGAAPLPTGLRVPMRERISNMLIRCVNEETGEIEHTHINDITKNKAILYKVTFANGNTVTSSMNHKYLTNQGWFTLEKALENNALFVAQGQKSVTKAKQEFPEIDESIEVWLPVEGWENYQVSSEGRLKRVGKYSSNKIRVGTPSKSNGYAIVSMNRPGIQVEYPIHQLVLKAFNPLPEYTDAVVRHKNHNKLDNRLSNLEWGTQKDNIQDSTSVDMHGRLRTNLTSVVDIECLGEQDSYDISVIGPWHNFICDGQVVHNSFQEFSQRYADVNQLVAPPLRACRLQDETNRQSSIPTDDPALNEWWAQAQTFVEHAALDKYRKAIEYGIAKEQARVLLPEGLTPSRMYMNGNLRSWIHFVGLRSGNGTQWEHQEIAKQIGSICEELFPTVWNALK